jgi:hypothetical protein
MTKQEQSQIAKEKASNLPQDKCLRVTAEHLSYYVFNFAGRKFVGYFDDPTDCPQKPMFKNKPLFEVQFKKGHKATMQRI